MKKPEGGISPSNKMSPTNKTVEKQSILRPRILILCILFVILVFQFAHSSRTAAESVGDRDIRRALHQAEQDRNDALSATANIAKQMEELASRVEGLDGIVRDALSQLEKVKGERDEANKRVSELDGTAKKAMEQMKVAHNQRDAAQEEVQKLGAKLSSQKEIVSTFGALEPSAVSSSYLTSEENILDQVVRLLLPPAEADAYIQQHPGDNFKFYLYELPDPYNYQSVAQCIANRYKNASNCDWGFTPCTEEYANDITYSKRRFNRNGDIVLAKILSDYKGPMRTMDPDKADLFIVPYPASGNCECRQRLMRCQKNIKPEELRELFGTLSHFKDDNKHRHLFLVSNIYTDTHWTMRDLGVVPLVTSIGPAQGCSPKNRDTPKLSKKYCGQVVIPYVNANDIYQPNNLLSHHKSSLVATKEEIVKERPNAIAAFLSTKIDGNPWARVQFLNDTVKLNYTIAGLPIITGKMRKARTMNSEQGIQYAYKTSIFCPCLRGDYPPQKRIFDAMLSGCIPVVLEAPSNEEGYVSHFAKESFSARLTYPFGQGLIPTYQNGTHTSPTMMGLNYSDLVVAVPSQCHKNGCMMEILEDLLENHPETIREKQQNIAKVVSLFSYGMGENGMKYPDAVAAMLASARQYVHTIYRAVDKAERMASLKKEESAKD